MGPPRWVIGWAMVGRAEFAYLIAQMAFASNMMEADVYSMTIWASINREERLPKCRPWFLCSFPVPERCLSFLTSSFPLLLHVSLAFSYVFCHLSIFNVCVLCVVVSLSFPFFLGLSYSCFVSEVALFRTRSERPFLAILRVVDLLTFDLSVVLPLAIQK